MAATMKQEQQHVAVGLGNGHFISVRQVSSDAATMQRGTCRHVAVAHATLLRRHPPLQLLCVGKLVIYNQLWKEYTYGTPSIVYAPRMKVIQTWVFRIGNL